MRTVHAQRQLLFLVMTLLVGGLILHLSESPALAAKKFARKECVDCHGKFNDKYLSMKYIHRSESVV